MQTRTAVQTLIGAGLSVLLAVPLSALADDDFHARVERMPEGKTGTWIIGGRSIEVTADTDLDEDHGLFRIDACVEVEFDDGEVEELETEKDSKCRS